MFKVIVPLERNETVAVLRQCLNQLIMTDEGTVYDHKTVNKIKKLQNDNDLDPTGVVDTVTWNLLISENTLIRTVYPAIRTPVKLPSYTSISHPIYATYERNAEIIVKIADFLKVDVTTALAVMSVESRGEGFSPDTGDILIRFENHIFNKRWGIHNPSTFKSNFRFDAKRKWQEHTYRHQDHWVSVHQDQEHEHNALELAKSLSTQDAYASASYGLPQIMGFHYERLGFETPEQMFIYMQANEEQQLILFFDFIKSDPSLLKAFQDRDWRTFARIYNGSGQVDFYSKFLERQYIKINKQEDK